MVGTQGIAQLGVFENISSLAQIGFNTLHCKKLYLYILTFAQVFDCLKK